MYIYIYIYIYQFQPSTSSRSNKLSTRITISYPPIKHLSNDPKEHPNQHKNSQKLCNEKGHLLLTLKESQWKLRQYSQNKYQHLKKERNPKVLGCESHNQGSK